MQRNLKLLFMIVQFFFYNVPSGWLSVELSFYAFKPCWKYLIFAIRKRKIMRV